MGFSKQLIDQAWIIANTQNIEMLDILLDLQSQQKAMKQQQQGQGQQQNNVRNSSNSQILQRQTSNYESNDEEDDDNISIEYKIRQDGLPVGLKNIGNTCYFNSLIQSYFFNPVFLSRVMCCQYPQLLDINKVAKNEQEKIKINSSIKLVMHLQRLFAFLIFSHKKYADPIGVLSNIVDDWGNKIGIGEEKDIGEFNLTFLERIEEGLYHCDSIDNIQNQDKRKKSDDYNHVQHHTNIQNELLLSEIDFSQQSTPKKNQVDQSVQIVQDELLLQSGKKILVQQKDEMMTSMFYGKRQEFIMFDQNNQNKQTQSQQVFSPIILDLQYKDLYSSWEAYNNFVVEDFKVSDEYKTNAKKEIWITQIPKNLMFQIQRVQYDQKSLQPMKMNDEFTFEKEIYIDRFLLKNKQYIHQSKPHLEELRKKKSRIEKELKHYDNYNNSKTNIVQILESCIKYVNEVKTGYVEEKEEITKQQDNELLDINDSVQQNNQNNQNIDSDDILSLSVQTDQSTTIQTQQSEQQIENIEKNTNQEITQNNLSQEEQITQNYLKKYKEDIEQKIQDLKQEQKSIQDQIDKIFAPLQEQKYVLHAILIHEGKSESGHYYAYIYQRNVKKWFKYSDISVKEEQESDVLKNAFGKGNTSAYCLMYLCEKILNAPIKYNFTMLQNIDKRQFDKQLTFSLVPKFLKEEIEKQNIKLQNQLKQQKQYEQAGQVIEDYTNRFEFVNQYVRQNKDKQKIMLLNQAAFIKYLAEKDPSDKKQYEEYLEIFKWNLLDTSLQQISNMSLHDLQKDQIFMNRINEHFQNMNEFKAPKTIKLQKFDFDKIDKLFSEYYAKIQSVVALTFTIDCVALDNWIDALHGVHKIINLNKTQSDLFYTLSRDVLRVILIKMGCLIFDMVGYQSVQKIKDYCNYILAYVKILSKNDNTLRQIQLILTEFLQYNGQKIFDQPTYQLLKTKIKDIAEVTPIQELKQYFDNIPQQLEDMIFDITNKPDIKLWKITNKTDIMEKQITEKMLQLKNYMKEFIVFHKTLKGINQQPLTIEQRIKLGYQNNTLI